MTTIHMSICYQKSNYSHTQKRGNLSTQVPRKNYLTFGSLKSDNISSYFEDCNLCYL